MGCSKLCNVLFTYKLARLIQVSGVKANARHPGLVRTSIARNNDLFGRAVNFFIGDRRINVDKGVETLVYLASSREVEDVTGEFFIGCRIVASSDLSYDENLASELWSLSERLTRE